MPRIEAGTVREHRELMEARIADAAERLLRDGGPEALTAGAVAAEAGIARNSLYRYVTSVEDMRHLVLMRHLPPWMSAVVAAVDEAADPADAVLRYVRANLEQAASSGHGWLITMARDLSHRTREHVAGTHDELGSLLSDHIRDLDTGTPELTTAVVHGILGAGFERLDAGDPPEQVIGRCLAATRAVLNELATARR